MITFSAYNELINCSCYFQWKGGFNMIKLICTQCGRSWYTANTKPNQRCSECDGLLVEVELEYLKPKDIISEPQSVKDTDSKVIFLDC